MILLGFDPFIFSNYTLRNTRGFEEMKRLFAFEHELRTKLTEHWRKIEDLLFNEEQCSLIHKRFIKDKRMALIPSFFINPLFRDIMYKTSKQSQYPYPRLIHMAGPTNKQYLTPPEIPNAHKMCSETG